jgi:hypothetical protein
MTKNARKEEWS